MGVSSLHREDAERRAAEYHVPGVFDEYTIMLDKVQPDFVDIATPAHTHLALVSLAAERGVHVLCQKPMAPSPGEVEAMIRVCEENGVALTINENARFQPWFRELAKIVAAGTLGHIRSLRITSQAQITLPSPDFGCQKHLMDAPQLIIMDLGVHHLDVARLLLGEADSLFALTQQISNEITGEDQALIVSKHRDTSATIFMSWAMPPYPQRRQVTWSEVTIEGDEGSALLSYAGLLEVWTPEGLVSRIQFSGDGIQQGYEAMQRHFVERLVSGLPAETDGRQTARTMELVFAAYESATSGNAVKTGNDTRSDSDG